LCKPQDFIEIFQIGGQENAKVVLAPSLKGGTNIMMLSPPNLITPSYGRWSYARHLRLAQKNNLNTYSVSNPRLSFDVDSPNDLRELLQRDIHGRTETSRNILQIGHMAPLPVKS
jgi:2-phospho-L-lactate guanylyltransferase (CobY/MobA/RfbA family)